jgi:hypothetical protein
MKLGIIAEPNLDLRIEALVAFLNSISEGRILFNTLTLESYLTNEYISYPRSFEYLYGKYNSLFADYEYVVYLTDKEYDNGYFLDEKGDIVIVSFANWEYFTQLPKNNGFIYFICSLFADDVCEVATEHHTIGCIFDFIGNKAKIDKAMKEIMICPTCYKYMQVKKIKKDKIIFFNILNKLMYELANASRSEQDIVNYWNLRMNLYPNLHQELIQHNAPAQEIDLSKHKPKDVSNFLKLFREEPLKWLTHVFDSAAEIFDLEQKLVEISTIFKQKAQDFTIPTLLYRRINAFIGNGDRQKWQVKNTLYDFNWRSDKIKQWCIKHPAQHPLSEEVFEKEILIFKESIQIRNNLETFMRAIITEKLGSDYARYTIEYDQKLKSSDFYTDTEKLRIGLGYLFTAIRQRGFEHTTVKIKWKSQRGIRKLSIIHVHSPLTKALNRDLLGGDLLEAERNFYQICDWSILANRPSNEFNKLNILFSVSDEQPNKPALETVETEIEGFTHELTFYI